jgi:hypothetical protein
MPKGGAPGVPTCPHPDRRILGNGLCPTCYTKQRRREGAGPRAKCHPTKQHYAKGLCNVCYKRAKADARAASEPEFAEHRKVLQLARAHKYTLREHGMTPEEYEVLVEAQGGVCAICGRPEPEGRKLHVDHNHRTGARRGLLCGPCNRALGMFEDDPERLLAAAAYLQHGGLLTRVSDSAP